VPDYDYHECEVARIFKRSGGVLRYLGDWHSHPGASGHLSEADAATLYTIGRDRQARTSRPIMVILAYGPTWTPVAWVGRPMRSALKRKIAVGRLDVMRYDTL
jgi:integrative and conjugative element protein (TIGR02256 family)